MQKLKSKMQNYGVRRRRTAIGIFLFGLLILTPGLASALQIQDFVNGADGNGLTAKAYLVIDKQSDAPLLQKDPQKLWVPASLTKLMTALVVLDYNPRLENNIAMLKSDEVGGARVYTKSGVSYKVKDLFYAMLVASANNAANALARSRGLSRAQFVAAMNKKAAELGALNTSFVDPSGISENNFTTAQDFAKIAKTAFEIPAIVAASGMSDYAFRSVNNRSYSHKVKNTNKLLNDGSLDVIAGKTGFLDESKYNFAALVKDQFGQESIVVLLGADNPQAQFSETRQLTFLAGLAKSVLGLGGLVLGESPR